jgi:hypothetical protein
MFSRWIVTNITSASVTTFLAFLAGIISWSVYCRALVTESTSSSSSSAAALQVEQSLGFHQDLPPFFHFIQEFDSRPGQKILFSPLCPYVEFLFLGINDRGVNLTTCLHLAPTLIMNGAIPPLLSDNFMA